MFLLIATSAALFMFFNLSPSLNGIVGISFQLSMSVLAAIALIRWYFDEKKDRYLSKDSTEIPPILWGQVVELQKLPHFLRLAIVLCMIALPVVVSKIVSLA